MLVAAIIPAKDEAGRIGKVLINSRGWAPDIIIVVVNGCKDETLGEVLTTCPPNTHIIEFDDPLGIDIPRAIGAKYAYDLGADIFVFLDGDMSGALAPTMLQLIGGIKRGSDVALVNCYPYITKRLPLTEKMLYFRKMLNQELGLLGSLGAASTSHGPHAISRKLLSKIGLPPLATPPVELAMARGIDSVIKVHAALPHIELSSQIRTTTHSMLVAETIIGDCIEAIHLAKGMPRSRVWEGVEYDGYHSQRRWDLLKVAQNNLDLVKIISINGTE